MFSFSIVPTPQQQNGNDCGVYVVAITTMVSERIRESSLDSKTPSDIIKAITVTEEQLLPATIKKKRIQTVQLLKEKG